MKVSYTKIKFSKKVINGKTPLFVKDLFCTPHFNCLNITFDKACLYGNVAFPIVVLSSK